jgi:hypothetical protein
VEHQGVALLRRALEAEGVADLLGEVVGQGVAERPLPALVALAPLQIVGVVAPVLVAGVLGQRRLPPAELVGEVLLVELARVVLVEGLVGVADVAPTPAARVAALPVLVRVGRGAAGAAWYGRP